MEGAADASMSYCLLFIREKKSRCMSRQRKQRTGRGNLNINITSRQSGRSCWQIYLTSNNSLRHAAVLLIRPKSIWCFQWVSRSLMFIVIVCRRIKCDYSLERLQKIIERMENVELTEHQKELEGEWKSTRSSHLLLVTPRRSSENFHFPPVAWLTALFNRSSFPFKSLRWCWVLSLSLSLASLRRLTNYILINDYHLTKKLKLQRRPF